MKTNIILLLLGIASYSFAADKEVTAPYPNFSPQPSANTLFCREILETVMDSVGNSTRPSPSSATVRATAPTQINNNYRLRLIFSSVDTLLVTQMLDYTVKNQQFVDSSFKIINDDPNQFFAVLDGAKTGDTYDVISLSRLNGTMTRTTVFSSFPRSKANPAIISHYYVCGSTP